MMGPASETRHISRPQNSNTRVHHYLGTARARPMYYSLIDEKGIDRFCEDECGRRKEEHPQ